jgi:hypothetical protein
MPFLIIGILIGMPLGVLGYFKLLADANEAGRKQATYENLKRQAEEEAKWNKPTTY